MTATAETLKAKDYKSDIRVVWCPGCGDYGVLNAVQNAFAALKLTIDNTVCVSGIGCSSRLPYFLKTYGFHSLHGRSLPVASGVKLANPNLEVVVFGGDGDLFSIGGGHFPHVARKNTDLTCVMMDNHVYGLTKGQASPTSTPGTVGTLTPFGTPDPAAVNPLAYSLTYGATFVAQGFSGDPKGLSQTVQQAISHKGFSFVNIISPCLTFNKVDTFDFFKDSFIDLPADHDKSNLVSALDKAVNPPAGKLYSGIFFETQRPTLVENLKKINQKAKADKNRDINTFIDEFKI
ncbi:MAG: 2-oxoacid:ferredoxin oxidoreductase subunit beta [Nitrospinae bacterium]|nr:2-oxoacid:ferredoxin oxidoreductase subunit beta [Nitrospinota bacterium]